MHGASRKAVVFLIDRTWKPILKACIDATATVFQDHMNDVDQAAMYSMGEGWIIPMVTKGTDPAGIYRKIKAAEENRGRCALYKSMYDVLGLGATASPFGQMLNDSSVSCWLIVLTDLVDLTTKVRDVQGDINALVRTMSNASQFNLAIIDSQTISGYEPRHARWPEWRSNVTRMVDGVGGSGNKSYHIAAHSAQEIQEAFARVATLMGAQAEEQL
mmetsp:Transcript_50387/g.132639  ORF Transcript_50387/g.132639 Transcript_50387/m.132639 type:complete len:216 (-) Transcript_50387:267-914(-)